MASLNTWVLCSILTDRVFSSGGYQAIGFDTAIEILLEESVDAFQSSFSLGLDRAFKMLLENSVDAPLWEI